MQRESHNQYRLVSQTVYNGDREECMRLSADGYFVFPAGLGPSLPLANPMVGTCCLSELQKSSF
jgi:hypothetical protein